MSTGKFCTDCEHYHERLRSSCLRPTDKINPVTGRPYVSGKFCWQERASIWSPFSSRCGPEGRHWKGRVTVVEGGE